MKHTGKLDITDNELTNGVLEELSLYTHKARQKLVLTGYDHLHTHTNILETSTHEQINRVQMYRVQDCCLPHLAI